MIKNLLLPERKKRSRLRYLMALAHLWLGLACAISVLFMCLSGSIYAFKSQIEDIINRSSLHVSPLPLSALPVDSVINSFQVFYGTPTRITLWEGKDRSVMVSSFSKQDLGTTAYYDPYIGKFLGIKNQGTERFFDLTLEFHRELLAGEAGKLINGTAALLFVLTLLSGFFIWIPKKWSMLRQSLTIKWPARRLRLNYDLHRVAGFYSIIFLLTMAVTGLYVSFHWVKNGIIVSLGGNPITLSESNVQLKKELSDSFLKVFEDLKTEESNEATESAMSIQQLLDIANEVLGYEGNTTIHLATDQVKYHRIIKIRASGPLGIYVPDIIELTASGKVKEVRFFNKQALHEQFKAIVTPLHTGEIWGLPGILLYFLACLAGCTLPVTGFIIFWKRKKGLEKKGNVGLEKAGELTH